MKTRILILFLGTCLLAGAYWYRLTAAECPVPLAYRLGNVDPAFDISADEALAYIATAEAVWEESVGRELFVYDQQAAFPINFIYDERQETANIEEYQREHLDAEKERSNQVLETVELLQAEYETLSVAYEARVQAYEERLVAYNTEVTTYNDRGGAPAEEFALLEDERAALHTESAALNQTVKELQSLVDKINQLAEHGNTLIAEYNHGVAAYNTRYGEAREFTQGDYQGDEINVYKFSTEAELISVLAHEFGHALGIGHVEGTSSLMYYLLDVTDTSSILSAEDLAAYYHVCGYTESYEQKVRRIVREVLAKI